MIWQLQYMDIHYIWTLVYWYLVTIVGYQLWWSDSYLDIYMNTSILISGNFSRISALMIWQLSGHIHIWKLVYWYLVTSWISALMIWQLSEYTVYINTSILISGNYSRISALMISQLSGCIYMNTSIMISGN